MPPSTIWLNAVKQQKCHIHLLPSFWISSQNRATLAGAGSDIIYILRTWIRHLYGMGNLKSNYTLINLWRKSYTFRKIPIPKDSNMKLQNNENFHKHIHFIHTLWKFVQPSYMDTYIPLNLITHNFKTCNPYIIDLLHMRATLAVMPEEWHCVPNTVLLLCSSFISIFFHLICHSFFPFLQTWKLNSCISFLKIQKFHFTQLKYSLPLYA